MTHTHTSTHAPLMFVGDDCPLRGGDTTPGDDVFECGADAVAAAADDSSATDGDAVGATSRGSENGVYSTDSCTVAGEKSPLPCSTHATYAHVDIDGTKVHTEATTARKQDARVTPKVARQQNETGFRVRTCSSEYHCRTFSLGGNLDKGIETARNRSGNRGRAEQGSAPTHGQPGDQHQPPTTIRNGNYGHTCPQPRRHNATSTKLG